MPGPDLDLVAFDLGGTTLQDRGAVLHAFASALDHHGLEVGSEELMALRGRSKRDAVSRLLLARQSTLEPSALAHRVDAVYGTFAERLTERLESEAPAAVEGAVDTFRWLRQRSIKIAITTGFERVVTMRLVDGLGWDASLIDAVVCADDVAVGRPAPYLLFRAMESTRAVRVSHVMAVGDTEADLLAADNARIGHSVAVLSGAHSRERLERRPHTAMLDSVAALPSLWA